MKSCNIMEAVTVSVEEKILKEWRHEGFIGGFTSSYLNMEIDGEEYVLVLHKVPNGHHFSEFTGGGAERCGRSCRGKAWGVGT